MNACFEIRDRPLKMLDCPSQTPQIVDILRIHNPLLYNFPKGSQSRPVAGSCMSVCTLSTRLCWPLHSITPKNIINHLHSSSYSTHVVHIPSYPFLRPTPHNRHVYCTGIVLYLRRTQRGWQSTTRMMRSSRVAGTGLNTPR